MTHYYDTLASPFGTVGVICSSKGVCRIEIFDDKWPALLASYGDVQHDNKGNVCGKVKEQLLQYFAKKRKTFDVEFDIQGTEFQQQVWKALYEIPWGETRSYKDIAVRIGNPAAVRAIGQANKRNPLQLIIPCHRVNGNISCTCTKLTYHPSSTN